MELPERFNNMLEIVPVVIDNTKRIVYVGNNSRYDFSKEVHESTYSYIQNDIRDFMNLYYIMNNSSLKDNCIETTFKKDKQKEKMYKIFSKNNYIINMYNLKNLSLHTILLDILKLLIFVLIIYMLHFFPSSNVCKVIRIHLELFLIIFIILFIINCFLKLKHAINCNKMKIYNLDTFKENIIESLDKLKYKKFSDNIYIKYNKNVLFLNNIDEISKYDINIKNTIIFLHNSDNIELNKFNKKYFIVTLLKKENYICIHKKIKLDKRIIELLKIMSFHYYNS